MGIWIREKKRCPRWLKKEPESLAVIPLDVGIAEVLAIKIEPGDGREHLVRGQDLPAAFFLDMLECIEERESLLHEDQDNDGWRPLDTLCTVHEDAMFLPVLLHEILDACRDGWRDVAALLQHQLQVSKAVLLEKIIDPCGAIDDGLDAFFFQPGSIPSIILVTKEYPVHDFVHRSHHRHARG